ncbi:MAG: phosphoribosyltransferase family protein [Meiothermus sp.]|nr:phosphoribosyltransferase family protein [Meiothermus sp.]
MGIFEQLFGLKCPGCDTPLTRATICLECEHALVPRHVPGFVYLGDYQRFGRLSRSIKYGGQSKLAEVLGRKMALGVRQAEWQLAGVTAVPTMLHRQAQRGYNQSELLARAAAEALKVPFKPVLQRAVYTKSQTKKTLAERLALPEDSFRATAKVGGVWLLIDDVLTTGTTYKRARAALLEAGAAKVHGAAIAVKSPHTLSEFSL